MKKIFLLCVILSAANISIANAATFFVGFKMPVTEAHRALSIDPQYSTEWLDSRHALLTTKENTDKQLPAGNHESPQQNYFLLKQQASEILRSRPNMIFVIPLSVFMVADLKKEFQDAQRDAYEDRSQSSEQEPGDNELNSQEPGDEEFDYQAPETEDPSDQEPGDNELNSQEPGDEEFDYQAPETEDPSDQEPGDKGLNYQEPGDEGLDYQDSEVQGPSHNQPSSDQQQHHQKKRR